MTVLKTYIYVGSRPRNELEFVGTICLAKIPLALQVTVTVTADGAVRCDWAVDARGAMPAPLPDGLSPCASARPLHGFVTLLVMQNGCMSNCIVKIS